MASEPDTPDPQHVAANDHAMRVAAERDEPHDVPPASPAAGVVDDDLDDPPEPSEPG